MTEEKKPIEGELVEENEKKEETAVETKKDEKSLSVGQESAEALIAQAIDKKVPVETMERLLAMRRELKQEYAKEEFNRAMSEFQADCPVIEKKKTVMNKDRKTVRYKYAPLDSIIAQIKDIIKKHGFSYTVNAEVENDWVTAVCMVTHSAGHWQKSEFKVPIDPSAFMNKQQQFASALTFSKRYAFCNAFGILTGDEDDDGNSASEQPQARNTRQAQKQAPAPVKKQAQQKKYCSRCWSQEKKKIEISQAEASYSKANYGYELCRNCQQAAKQAKEHKEIQDTNKKTKEQANNEDNGPFGKPGSIAKYQLSTLKSNAFKSIGSDNDQAIIQFLSKYGFNIDKLENLSYKQAKAANDILLANIGEEGSL